MKEPLPFLLQYARGAIGKEFVIKRHRNGRIKTKYPDMTRIIASMAQRKCRNMFREAVLYAKEVIADTERKRQWQKRIRRRNGVYNEAVKFYMLKDKKAKEAAILEAQRLLRIAMKNEERALTNQQNPIQPGAKLWPALICVDTSTGAVKKIPNNKMESG
jgi:hypothetical protein